MSGDASPDKGHPHLPRASARGPERVGPLHSLRGRRGGEGYYGPLAAFALIRTVRSGLGSNAAYLDQILAELCRLERSGAYNRIDQFESMVVPHQVMQALGLADPRQAPDLEEDADEFEPIE